MKTEGFQLKNHKPTILILALFISAVLFFIFFVKINFANALTIYVSGVYIWKLLNWIIYIIPFLLIFTILLFNLENFSLKIFWNKIKYIILISVLFFIFQQILMRISNHEIIKMRQKCVEKGMPADCLNLSIWVCHGDLAGFIHCHSAQELQVENWKIEKFTECVNDINNENICYPNHIH